MLDYRYVAADSNLGDLTFECLEAARAEVVRRLRAADLPTGIASTELIVTDDPDMTGWSTKERQVKASSIGLREVARAVADETVPGSPYGLRDELWPLAELLSARTPLADRPSALLPALTGPEAILGRYLVRMVDRYFRELPDLANGDRTVTDRLARELETFAAQDAVVQISQIAVDGVHLNKPLEYRNVRVRPLTGQERGLWLTHSGTLVATPRQWVTDFVPRAGLGWFAPRSLLEVKTVRKSPLEPDQAPLLSRVALAFYLCGFDLSATGALAQFDEPIWASFGIRSSHFAVAEKMASEVIELHEEDFRQVVDLANKMPDFAVEQPGPKHVALERALRGFGSHWTEFPFLDFAISLEAALLQGATSELAYRFALYGARFLSPERDPQVVHEQLKNIYRLRSQIVHGGRVKADRQAALVDAQDLTRAVLRRALDRGWPDSQALDKQAVGRL
jgi:hypothetical protein